MKLISQCDNCKISETIIVDADDWDRYQKGELVQNVWPELDAESRELIIGARHGGHFCNKCWDLCIPEEE